MRSWVVAVAGVLAALFGGEAQAFGDCESPGYLASFDLRLTRPEPCDVIQTFEIRFGGDTVRMRLIRLRSDGHGDDARWIPHVEALARQAGPQIEAMGGLSLAPVSVLLTTLQLRDRTGTTHAAAEGRVSPEECKISSSIRWGCGRSFASP
jgi:hypothetical protein